MMDRGRCSYQTKPGLYLWYDYRTGLYSQSGQVKSLSCQGRTDLVVFAGFCSIGGHFVLSLGGLGSGGIVGTLHGGGSMSSDVSFSYRSPVAKLLRFFRHSRDQWKVKCQTAKQANKSLKLCLAKMKESRDRWKTEARGLRDKLQAETARAEEPTKKRRAASTPSRPPRPPSRVS
jgi:hypothetical protein